MKAKSPNQSKQKRTDAPLKDLEPREDPKGGFGLPTGGTTSSLQSKSTLADPEDLLKRK